MLNASYIWGRRRGRGWQVTPAAIVKATQEESFHITHSIIAGKSSSWSRGLVEHKGTQNQCHFPSCSETGHKERRRSGGCDTGWHRVTLCSLRRWPLTRHAGMRDDSLLPYKFGVVHLWKLPWRESTCNWAKRQYTCTEKQQCRSWEQVNFHVYLRNLISVDSSARDEIKRR